MRILFILFITFVLGGCSVQKWCNEKYPPPESIETTTWMSYYCDSFPVYLPANDLLFDTSGVIPSNINFHHSQTKGRLRSTVDINNGKLTVLCAEDSLKMYIEHMKEVQHEKIAVTKKVPVYCKEEHRTNADIFCRWWTWISIILLIVSVIGYCYIRAVKA